MEPVSILATLAAAAVVVLKAVDIVRQATGGRLDGWAVNAVSVLVGVAVAFSTGLAATVELAAQLGLALTLDVPREIDLAITGVVLGLGAGYFADLRSSKVKAAEAAVFAAAAVEATRQPEPVELPAQLVAFADFPEPEEGTGTVEVPQV